VCTHFTVRGNVTSEYPSQQSHAFDRPSACRVFSNARCPHTETSANKYLPITVIHYFHPPKAADLPTPCTNRNAQHRNASNPTQHYTPVSWPYKDHMLYMTESHPNCHGNHRASSPSDVKPDFFFRVTTYIYLRLTERTSGSHTGYQGYDRSL
jgi:hypothetical protein